MPLKSPSKFTSLKYLVLIAESDFCNKDKGIDYVPEEVLSLIHQKQQKKSEEEEKAFNKELYETYMRGLKLSERKLCTSCKLNKKYEEFHVDKSKKTFGLRSHCKGCRSIPF